jgi:hypothetical protein
MIMTTQIELSDPEWQLILELLKAERRELPSEIRHTDTRAFRKDLGERMHTVDSLVSRLTSVPLAAHTL